MFNTGIVIHYVREYSKSETKAIKSIVEKYVAEKSIDPDIKNDEVLNNIVDNLPVGTIVCIDLSDEKTKKAYICFPMFSSHMSLPLKQGEIVWFYKDRKSSFDKQSQEGSPLLSINNFWLSRKIGSKLSEDLNFSHIIRDSKITDSKNDKNSILEGLPNQTVADKQKNRKTFEEEKKKIRLPDYKLTTLYSKKYNFLQEFSSLYNSSKEKEDFVPAAVPRWYSQPHEFSLQGSNNSLINLTKTYSSKKEIGGKGAVDIVAGRHAIEEYKEVDYDDDFYIIKDKFVANISDAEKRNISELKINTNNSFMKIKNVDEDEELLKNQTLYFNEEFKTENSEGNLNLNNDASRLYITESDVIDSLDSTFYDTSSLLQLKSIGFDKDRSTNEVKKDYLVKDKSIKIENFSTKKIELTSSPVPSVFIKTNNVRIVARKKRSNSEKSLKEGSIRLIKESDDFYNTSHVMLESDGKVLIDGNCVMIGNFEKEEIRQNNDLSSMHGNGYGVLLGYNKTLSEPLVLGNSLESMLREVLNINIKLVEEIKILTDDLQSHIHLGIPGSGVSGPPQVPKAYADFSSSKQSEITKRYTDIQNGLKDMLSRFAKTT